MIRVDERKSRFGAITIFKTKKTGSFIYAQGDSFQSEADANGISLVAYIHAMFSLLRQAGSRNVLMIGCGGGTLATMLSNVDCKLTVVDIDPHAFLLARRYFRFPPDVACRVADGCEFLLSETGTFDAIVLDAFMEGNIPAHLKSAAFFSLVRKRVSPSGCVVVNVHVENDLDAAADRMASEMAKVWPDVRILDRVGQTNRNAILMAGGVRELQKPTLLMLPAMDAGEIVAELRRWHFAPARLGLGSRLLTNQEPLYALTRVDLAGIDVAARFRRDHMHPVQPAAAAAEEAEMAERTAVGAVHDPDHVVHDVGDIDEALIGREGHAAG